MKINDENQINKILVTLNDFFFFTNSSIWITIISRSFIYALYFFLMIYPQSRWIWGRLNFWRLDTNCVKVNQHRSNRSRHRITFPPSLLSGVHQIVTRPFPWFSYCYFSPHGRGPIEKKEKKKKKQLSGGWVGAKKKLTVFRHGNEIYTVRHCFAAL